MASKRIAYIDSLRGITMIFVIASHVLLFSYNGLDQFSLFKIITIFRMPLFFFISGFILYKDYDWNLSSIREFIKKKFMIQIIPTTIFFLIYIHLFNLDLVTGLYDKYKYGYWFCITLFFFFLFYIVTTSIANKFNRRNFVFILSAILVSILFCMSFCGIINEKVSGIMGINTYNYYIFFVFGILCKKNIDTWNKITENKNYMLTIILCFILTAYIYITSTANNRIEFSINYAIYHIAAFMGVTWFFSYIKHHATFFTESTIGKVLQFIGRRTLDIYLLHYFLIPRNMTYITNYLEGNYALEFIITMILALLVILMCLIVSSIFRINPILKQYLFGVKQK